MGVVEGAFEQRSTRDIIIMAREINMDTMRQNFWAESIKKETQMRRSWYSTHQSKEQSTKSMENSNQILQRRASKLRAFVPKAVDRKIEGYNENETEVKLPELLRNAHRTKWRNAPILCTPSTT